MSIIYIYGLSGNDNIIRYVGQSYRPTIRKNDHVSQAKNGVKSHKANWLRKLINNGEDIKVHILEVCDETNWAEREIYWISKLPNLTNVSEGGNGFSGSKYKLTFKEFQEWCIDNCNFIKSENMWRNWIKDIQLPTYIPRRPDHVYRDKGWVSWGSFMGAKVEYLNYEDLKNQINEMDIKNSKEYFKNRKLNMPYNPKTFYSEWVSWDEFLNKKKKFIVFKEKIKIFSYEKTKMLIKNKNFTTKKQYLDWYSNNKGKGFPANPTETYKKEWKSYNDFFGNDLPRQINKPNIKTHFLTYDECKKWVLENLNVKSENMWREFKDTPTYIPRRPDYVYRDKGWEGWTKFFKS